ncbi:MAG: nucleotidyltransferase [Acidobacteria bacterium]|nr:MAG: nucleotidyltransferase [Acidobacteriota bacterium]
MMGSGAHCWLGSSAVDRWRVKRKVSVQKALILAAGNGRRLKSYLHDVPKPLMPVGGIPILRRVVLSAQRAGISHFVITVGDQAGMIREHFARDPLPGITLQWIRNDEPEKGNGVSALKAQDVLPEPFLLLMADHLFEPETARALLEQPLPSEEVILAVDRKLDGIFDIEDATKVQVQGDRIIDIGKELVQYQAVDTGMFLCGPALFDALEASLVDGDAALTDGMRYLARRGRLRAFDIGEAIWCDIDTPQAVQYAEQCLKKRKRAGTH